MLIINDHRRRRRRRRRRRECVCDEGRRGTHTANDAEREGCWVTCALPLD